MKLSTQDIIAKFLKDFDRVNEEIRQSSKEERLRFSHSIRGAWLKARRNLEESLEFVKLSKSNNKLDPGTSVRHKH